MFNAFKHVLIALIPYALTLTAIRITGYIDESVLKIYIPLFLMGASPLVFNRRYIGYIFLAGVCVGLIGEYVMHAMNPNVPNVQGVTFNIMCMAGGVLVGGVAEYLAQQHKKLKRMRKDKQ